MIDKKAKLLIADPSTTLIDAILQQEQASKYEIAIAQTGPIAIKKVKDFKPDLLVIDLTIPCIHGIDVIKTIKKDRQSRQMGIIVSSYYTMIQHYHIAIEEGGDYFLKKPFHIADFFSLVEQFFAGDLKPVPFSFGTESKIEKSNWYRPLPSNSLSYLRFWGTRGSSPVAGADYLRYGGNTSCLEVCHGNDRLVIDAGTGIRQLGELLKVADTQTIHLFISHTHWDHIAGFPFFDPLYKKSCHVVLWAPIGFEKNDQRPFHYSFCLSLFSSSP